MKMSNTRKIIYVIMIIATIVFAIVCITNAVNKKNKIDENKIVEISELELFDNCELDEEVNEINEKIKEPIQKITEVQVNNISEEVISTVKNELSGYVTMEELTKLISQELNSPEEKKIYEANTLSIMNTFINSKEFTDYMNNMVQAAKGKDGRDGLNGRDGQNGINGKDGKDGDTPIKGRDYFTENDINEIAEKTTELVNMNYMERIVSGVTLKLMEDGNITLSTYQSDVIDAMVKKLMEETVSHEYIKSQVLDSVQSMILASIAEAYNNNVIYKKGDVVAYNGCIYISTEDNNTENPSEGIKWNQITLTKLIEKFNNQVISQLNQIDYEFIPDGNGSGKVLITMNGGN